MLIPLVEGMSAPSSRTNDGRHLKAQLRKAQQLSRPSVEIFLLLFPSTHLSSL